MLMQVQIKSQGSDFFWVLCHLISHQCLFLSRYWIRHLHHYWFCWALDAGDQTLLGLD